MRVLFVFIFLLSFSCGKKEKLPPIDENVDLDGSRINDSSLARPSDFLVSAADFTPGIKKPAVFIAVHGFSASTFEWLDFNYWCARNSDAKVSRVLLGGHGRDYKDFREATWIDWQRPIVEEYKALRAKDFEKIHIIASSTGCALVLEALASGKIITDQPMTVTFIDPIIVPSNKQLSLAPLVGGSAIKYTLTEMTAAENGFWYKYRPQEALRELNKVTIEVRKRLEKGITLPHHIKVYVYKSVKDEGADPVSAVLLEKGLNHCQVTMIDSEKHVFTRLIGRDDVNSDDLELQEQVFKEILGRL